MTRIYLIAANIILAVFAIWFSNVGLLPFNNMSDFLFFLGLGLVLAIYRPGWTFVFFAGSIALENINLAPKSFGLMLRPYQFFGLITIIALFVQIVSKRLVFPLPKWGWYDALPVVFGLAGILSSLGAQDKGMSFKQAIVAVSFVALYFLTRVYVQSFEDSKRVTPFFLSSSLVVLVYSIWQNVIFLQGGNSFEVMPGRPNGTFTEPDWLGIYLVFTLSVVYSVIYKFSFERNKKQETIAMPTDRQTKQISKFNIQNFSCVRYWKLDDWVLFVSCFLFLVILYAALILTVSRSAWVGAAIVIIGFLKMTLINSSWRISEWEWKKFSLQGIFITATLFFSILLSMMIPLTNFQIFNRAQSTGGLQKITISCDSSGRLNSESVIESVDELSQYGCRHINLEEIESEKAQGKNVSEIMRPDPSVNIRAEIYKKSIDQIKANPIIGIGWGSISGILGKDESGAGLNASNVFLEVWLGSGLLGIISFSVLLLYILIVSSVRFMDKNVDDKTPVVFVMLGWVAIVVPNLFNSGIFLGFVWLYLAVAVGLLKKNKI